MPKKPSPETDNIIPRTTFEAALKVRRSKRQGKNGNKYVAPHTIFPRDADDGELPFEVGQFANHQRTVDGTLKALAVIVVLLKQATASMRVLTSAQVKRLLHTLTQIEEGLCWPHDDMLAQLAFQILTGHADSDDIDI
jgi:hypothetical protein